jgi:hypothetical protein
MPSPDTAQTIKNSLAAAWATTRPTWTVTLHVDDDYVPTAGKPTLLVADDGGPPVRSGAWLLRRVPRRPTIRLTAFAKGRDESRLVAAEAADWLIANHPAAGVARIEDVSDPLMTRDRATGAYLASITMPVVVRPITA